MKRTIIIIAGILVATMAWAVNSYYTITLPDGSTKFRTTLVTQGSETVHIQGMLVCNPTGTWCAVVDQSGALLTYGTITANVASTATHTVNAIITSSTGTQAMVEARKQTPTGNALNVQIGPADTVNNITPVIMDWSHHQTHEAETHAYGYYSTSVNSIDFIITVPTFTNTIQGPHMLIHASIYEGSAELALFEGPTYSGGATVTSYNRNRNGATAPRTTIKSGVSVTTTGTRMPNTAFLASGSKFAGAENRTTDEWILKSNTDYLVRFEEITAVSRVAIHFEWYEDLGI